MTYEKICTVSMILNAAIVKGDLGRAVKVVRSVGNSRRIAKVAAAGDTAIGVLAQDGPLPAGSAVPVAVLVGILPVKVASDVEAGEVATLNANGGFDGGAGKTNIATNAMAAGVFAEDVASGGIGELIAMPLFKSA